MLKSNLSMMGSSIRGGVTILWKHFFLLFYIDFIPLSVQIITLKGNGVYAQVWLDRVNAILSNGSKCILHLCIFCVFVSAGFQPLCVEVP